MTYTGRSRRLVQLYRDLPAKSLQCGLLGPTNVYGRQNHLGDVVGGFVSLGTTILTRSPNLFCWASVPVLRTFRHVVSMWRQASIPRLLS